MSQKHLLLCALLLAGAATSAAFGLDPGVGQAETSQAFQEELEKGQALLSQGKVEDAVKAFKRANKLRNDSSVECYWGLAQAYLKLGAHKNVRESCDQILQLTTENELQAKAHNLKGVALSAEAGGKIEKLKEAEREFRAALGMSANIPVVHFNLGTVLLQQFRDSEGQAELQAYLTLAPTGGSAQDARSYLENPRRARENFAPNFSLTSMQGEYVSLEDLQGKVVLVDFWASWCGPCVAAAPELQALYKRNRREKFVLLSISSDQDEQAWRNFIAKHGMEWPQYRDHDDRLFRLFMVRSIPSYFVIDGEGIVRRSIAGWGGDQGAILDGEIKKSLKALDRAAKR